MRGVAFIGGEGPLAQVSALLAQDAAVIVAADSGLHAAEAAGIRPDWIVGDMDSLEDEAVLAAYPAGRVLRYSADKDWTDTELAVDMLFDKGCDEVILVGGGGGRLAHIIGLYALFERERRPVRWRTAREDVFLACNSVEFDAAPGTVISVFPMGESPWKAASINLKWPLDAVKWRRGFFGLSNAATDHKVRIDVLAGMFLIIIEC
ncbi:MAG: thiamine diphosphokinase [Spirochaetaceae bacterium]|jgi:thiamine pyrophosphokinase|nr:thiamine diphosphokinase [Spirochaetaceae bacterium]